MRTRFSIDVYSVEQSTVEANTSGRTHWVEIEADGGCAIIIYFESAAHANRVAAAINSRDAINDDMRANHGVNVPDEDGERVRT